MPDNDKEKKEKILKLIAEALTHDKELRENYKVGEKFRFIRDRLQALAKHAEENIQELQVTEVDTKKLSDDEVLVFVHLFNAQGLVLQTWQKFLSPSVYYEYSINRPVYSDKAHIESFIRSRGNKVQHGYLTVAIKKSDIVTQPEEEQVKDNIGNIMLKVKEGSLRPERMQSFTHNEHHYILGEDGTLKRL